MYVRFVIREVDRQSGRRQGLFQAMEKLEECGRLSSEDANRLETIYGWFKKHLEKPTRLAISSRHHGKQQALSWFKDTAADHIAKMRELQEVLDRYGMSVEMITAKRLGYVLYEDEFQVAAYPFSDTPT
jgi:hypothetical protein